MRIILFYIILILLQWSCTAPSNQLEVMVKNSIKLDRTIETVSIPVEKLASLKKDYSLEDIIVKDTEGKILVSQLIDNNQDGIFDEFLFQTQLKANEEKSFFLKAEADGKSMQPKSELTTFSRFVPERTDDYTWENDRVAFRTFGMEAQRMVEEKEAGGTLTSGIDLWLKRVSYPIIDEWYRKNLDSIGYYHVDHGEGCDPYHVGKSRGTGGIGIWKEDTLYTSKNFIAYRTIATGPIRTVFELDYAPWSDYEIKETKRISLDLGANFSKFDLSFQGEQPPPNYTIGITLHEGEGQIYMEEKEGWFRHWEPMDGSYLGQGIIIAPNSVERAFTHTSNTPDQSQLFVVTKPTSTLSYLAGFGWQKSGQVKGVEDWDAQLKRQAAMIKDPLQIQLK